MKAVRVKKFGDERVLEVEEIEKVKPKAGEILVKVAAAGINPVDTYIRSGNYLPSRLPSLPYTPGGDVSGTVEAIGEGVTEFKTGDKVYSLLCTSSGAYAEYSTVKETFAVKLHDGLSLIEGAAIGVPYFTADRALRTLGGAKKGENLLIHGASGGVGLAAIQIAKFLGLNVVGTAGSADGIKLIESFGIKAYNHRAENYLAEMRENEKPFDIIVEMLANINLQNDLTLLKGHGRIMVVGNRGDIEINPRLLMGPETEIRGISLWNLENNFADKHKTIELLEAMAKSRTLKPVLGKRYSLTECRTAHHEILKNSGSCGKMYFEIS